MNKRANADTPAALAGLHEPTAEPPVVESDETAEQGTEDDDHSAAQETGPDETTNSGETPDSEADETDETDESDEGDSDATTFSREYVSKLRRENASYRERANRADELANRLHTARVAATGRLADPTDLAFDAAHLDDDDALEAAIDELLAAKPHLASRRVTGDIGQGRRGAAAESPVNLADILRSRA